MFSRHPLVAFRSHHPSKSKWQHWNIISLLFVVLSITGYANGSGDKESRSPLTSGSIETFKTHEVDLEEFTEYCELGVLMREAKVLNDDVKGELDIP